MSNSCVFEALSARAPARYTAYELPSYRFVPGERPHPVADPQGHSHGRQRRYPAAPLDGWRWRDSGAYLFGCDLYNRGFWWEAHEAWEAIWHLAGRRDPERAALQGLIQLANCHLKLHMGRVRAVARLQRHYGEHFERAADLVGNRFMGLDFAKLRSESDAYVLHVSTRRRPAHDPATYPFLCLSRDGGTMNANPRRL